MQAQYGNMTDEELQGLIDEAKARQRSGQAPDQATVDLAIALAQGGNGRDAADLVVNFPEEMQGTVFEALNAYNNNDTGNRLQASLQQGITEQRQQAFKEWAAGGGRGPLPPGVDRSGGGTGLTPDAVQSLLSAQATNEAEGLQNQQPGLSAYQQDVTLDQGPGSFLDRLKGEGAFYDESIDGMKVREEGPAFQQERTDTTGRDAQGRSLDAYDQVIEEEGLTAIDRARIEEMRADTARRARGQEEAILADAAERGRGGSNASLLLRNQGQQSATNTRALGDMQTAAMGLQRKDTAIMNRGFLGGDVQASDDAIDKFNTQQSQEVLQRDVDRTNRAEADRWGLEQDNKNENVDVTQGALGVEYDNDASRSDRNTDRTNANAIANDFGEQQHYQDQVGSFLTKYGVTQTGPGFDAGDKSTPGAPGDSGIASAGQGAIGGASAGSALGPYGAAIGAVAGGAAGFLGGRKKRERGSSGAW